MASRTNNYVKTVVVVGNPGTGKSTLIQAAKHNDFPGFYSLTQPPTTLLVNETDMVDGPINKTRRRSRVRVIDTSLETQESRDKLVQNLRLADAVVVTASYDNPSSFKSLASFWLPQLRRHKVNVPVIVAGCKSDYRKKNHVSLKRLLAGLMKCYIEIDHVVDCSARKVTLVRAPFMYALRSVAFPVGPLFDRKTRTMTPEFVMACRHIFLLCDHDQDGILSDAEFTDFQRKCRVPEAELEGVNERGITFDKFLAYHLVHMKKNDARFPWRMLHRFGLHPHMKLSNFGNISSSVLFRGATDETFKLTKEAVEFLKLTFSLFRPTVKFELSNVAITFLKLTFNLIDLDKDGVLQTDEVDELFSSSQKNPWNEAPYKNVGESMPTGGLTFEGFLLKWILMTLLEPFQTIINLIYIGYWKDPFSAFHIIDRKDILSYFNRNVIRCFVFGSKNAGKSELLNAFLRRPFLGCNKATNEDCFAVNYLDGRKTLILLEIAEDKVENLISDNDSLASCDIAIFVHDSSENSWKKTTDLLLDIDNQAKYNGFKVPCLIVKAKDDLFPSKEASKRIKWACKKMRLHEPISVSTKQDSLSNLFQIIVGIVREMQSIPVTKPQEVPKREMLKHSRTCPLLRIHPIKSEIPRTQPWRATKRVLGQIFDNMMGANALVPHVSLLEQGSRADVSRRYWQ